ncbi:MAG: ABC transporter permease [Gammaproteobacteria bacterium]|nr:ABC transporter permease [Gammaproteobacteria bacterium]MDD9896812.1 ABC transporter permease [Gammaproteobacteria bacterium]MDD9959377.1 ABC transporter permease [Gammaproteobacteria bacterium]
MVESEQIIEFGRLFVAFLPPLAVVLILFKWTTEGPESIYALARMLGQLLVIGYFLSFIFESNSSLVVLSVLLVMVVASSWIALRTVKTERKSFLQSAFIAILVGGGVSLLVSTQFVLLLDSYYEARYVIPLAGMAFANAMNSISICAERFRAEIQRGIGYTEARTIAFRSALIPITNSLFAVGLVSFPGMMTGQILVGVDPLIAARYQIMVMCMLFSSSGLSSACFLLLIRRVSLVQERSTDA